MSLVRHTGTVRFSETDASGRFHYTHALRWAEDAEHTLYHRVGVPVSAFPRRAVSATYERPFVTGDEYAVELEVARLGTTSVTYSWQILNGDAVAVTGEHTVVHLDESGKPTALPHALRTALGEPG